MSKSEFEAEYDRNSLATITGKPTKIEIEALKTKEAYDREYKRVGLVPTSYDDLLDALRLGLKGYNIR
jgi:hypothetical protein